MNEKEYVRLRDRVNVDAEFMGINGDEAVLAFSRECRSVEDARRLLRRVESVEDDYKAMREMILNAISLDEAEKALLDKAYGKSLEEHRMVAEAARAKVTLSHYDDKVNWDAYETMNYTHLDWPVWVRRIVFKDATADMADWYQIIARSRIHWPRSIRIAMHRAMKLPFYALSISLLRRGCTQWDVKAIDLLVEINHRIARCEKYVHQLNVLVDRLEACETPLSPYDDKEMSKRAAIEDTLINRLKNLLIPMRTGTSVEKLVSDLLMTTKDTQVIKVIDNHTEIRVADTGVLKGLYAELSDAGLYRTSYSNFHKQINK